MSAQRQPFLVAAHAFFIRGNNVLLARRANTGYMDGLWSVPAGHVDGGETIWEAMAREIQEECGLELTDEQTPTHVMHRMKQTEANERVDYFFVLREWTGEPNNCEPEKCSEFGWFALDRLPQDIVPYIAFALQQLEQKKAFSEFCE